ncbi:MAG: phage integrase SAM-like domain-containing protein [Bacteroidales bacterium]|nr:phage integrase SAM-like domain-containing protein [Bacteroidales bacterium]
MRIKYKLKYGTFLYWNKDKEINAQIRMRISYCGSRVDIPLGITIESGRWDPVQRKMTEGGRDAHGEDPRDVNSTLQRYEALVANIFKGYEYHSTIPSPHQLKADVKAAFQSGVTDNSDNNGSRMPFAKAMELFKLESGRRNAWADRTYAKFDTLEKDVLEFSPRIRISDFNEETLTDFVYFLQTNKKSHPRNLANDDKDNFGQKNSTIEKKVSSLKWFLKWAFNKGYLKDNSYASFKPKLKNVDKTIIFLTEREIKRLCDFEIPPEYERLEKIRDVFVFCCYSSLRWSDVENLRRADLKESFMAVTTVKTADNIEIEYNNITTRILEKYKDCEFEGDRALPVLSNQKMNDGLKLLFRLAGFNEKVRTTYFKAGRRYDNYKEKWQLITTHAGRRSFICNALAKGIPVNVVMEWTGHSGYMSMKPYIAVAEEVKKREMTKFNTADIAIR